MLVGEVDGEGTMHIEGSGLKPRMMGFWNVVEAVEFAIFLGFFSGRSWFRGLILFRLFLFQLVTFCAYFIMGK